MVFVCFSLHMFKKLCLFLSFLFVCKCDVLEKGLPARELGVTANLVFEVFVVFAKFALSPTPMSVVVKTTGCLCWLDSISIVSGVDCGSGRDFTDESL